MRNYENFPLAHNRIAVASGAPAPRFGAEAGHRAPGDAPARWKASRWMKRRIGDRRSKPRFEIVGDLWASVDTTSSLLLQNVGPGGALLESTVPLAASCETSLNVALR